MGCIESKKTIEAITEGDIKFVCSLDVFNAEKQDFEGRGGGGGGGGGGGSGDDATTSTTKKSKLKIKYDPRVTAKYELKGTMGKGSFTSVVWVENRQTKKPYAIKIYDSNEGREAFEAELAVLRRVKCPYIIKLVEVFENTDKMYMVMELATGGSLMERILERRACSEREAVRVLRMILEGVKYLHSLGITHRDLKPDNVLFYHPGADSRLMIVDFGLAHARGSADETTMNTICGTPEYIAPEMVLWKAYTSAVDLWAAGVVTYILLAGDFPFHSENRSRLYKNILKGAYSMDDEVWSKVSEPGRDFVRRLLDVNPETRLTAAAALAHPWIKAHRAAHSRTHAQEPSPGSESWSVKSSKSSHSGRSGDSLRTGGRRKVTARDLHHLHHHHHQSRY
ncbi:serine/threonine-protein kinase H1 homolog isoform X2 [Eriocheir sinensis]|uniref:serine/threonine-protein kinase H1 homolog isoform X2 n=1 Tax=Eriocheir sinensis TaxID=95602 RepID=UPI0021C683D8|nr:serine/threonine-protein kinase H1 homolog isoform X2 [Eriocheir sinensis]